MLLTKTKSICTHLQNPKTEGATKKGQYDGQASNPKLRYSSRVGSGSSDTSRDGDQDRILSYWGRRTGKEWHNRCHCCVVVVVVVPLVTNCTIFRTTTVCFFSLLTLSSTKQQRFRHFYFSLKNTRTLSHPYPLPLPRQDRAGCFYFARFQENHLTFGD